MKWVKCREQLPKEKGRYCVYLANKFIFTDYYALENIQNSPENSWKRYFVVAWLPIPEVYYPKKNEDGWKPVFEDGEVEHLPDGHYFVSVGDLVHVVSKCEDCLWTDHGEVPCNRVDAYTNLFRIVR